MPHEIVIWLDCSTTTCKAPASDRQGRVVAESRATFEELTPHPGWHEDTGQAIEARIILGAVRHEHPQLARRPVPPALRLWRQDESAPLSGYEHVTGHLFDPAAVDVWARARHSTAAAVPRRVGVTALAQRAPRAST